MSSAFTAPIKDGISFEQFAMGCARSFGACITMRDEPDNTPIPDEFKPSTYHIERIDECRKHLKELKEMSSEQAEEAAKKEHEDEINRITRSNEESRLLKDKYTAMLIKVRDWQPPSPSHVEFKEFMQKQIEESIAFDCIIDETTPTRKSGIQWREEAIRRTLYNIEHHADCQAKEESRTAERNLWLRQLRGSLAANNTL
jgi:hypothetical protein